MNGFWHLLATDLRRQRWLLLLWLFIVAGSATALGLMPMAATNARAASQAGLVYFLLCSSYLVLFVFIVPLVIQTDPTVGSDAFWMTRPIPPTMLFTEKFALVVLALVMLPIAADVVLMAVYDVPVRGALGVVAQGIIFKTSWVIGLMTLAVLSGNLPRFALLAGAVMAALVGMAAVTVVLSISEFNEQPPLSQTGTSWSQTAVLLSFLGLVAGGVALVFLQYLNRRRARSVVVGSACAILGFAAASAMPAPPADSSGDAPTWARDAARVHLTGGAGDARISTQSASRSGRAWKLVSAPVYAEGLEPGWSAEIAVRDGNWQVDGRTVWRSQARIGFQPTRIEKQQASFATATRQLLGVSRVIEIRPSWDTTPLSVLAVVDEKAFSTLPATTGPYTAYLEVSLMRHLIEGVLPLKQGVESRSGAHRLLISRVYHDGAGVTILLRASSANSMFGDEPGGERLYFVRNRVASEAVPVSLEPADVSGLSFVPWMGLYGFSAGGEGYSSGFSVTSWLVKVGSLSGPDGPIWRLTDEWLDNAELVVTTSHREGSVGRELRVDNFPLRTAPEATTQ
jgi:hypothetical protein